MAGVTNRPACRGTVADPRADRNKPIGYGVMTSRVNKQPRAPHKPLRRPVDSLGRDLLFRRT